MEWAPWPTMCKTLVEWIIVPFLNEFTKKLVFLCELKTLGLENCLSKDISNIFQGLMKMVEGMEDEGLLWPKGEIGSEVTQK